jgi:hypothetical protein
LGAGRNEYLRAASPRSNKESQSKVAPIRRDESTPSIEAARPKPFGVLVPPDAGLDECLERFAVTLMPWDNEDLAFSET